MTPDPIAELEIEIRFLEHLIQMYQRMTSKRRNLIENLRKHHKSDKVKIASKQIGGYARSRKLTKERRSEIGRIAAKARWGKG